MADITGTAGPDTLDGTEDADVINGLGGDDFLRGNGGNDRLIAGTGYDILLGGSGDDELYFGADFTTADYAGGGAGSTDRLILQGNYAATMILGAGQLFDLERIELLSGSDTRFGDTSGSTYTYNLRMADANLAAGGSLSVDLSGLRQLEHVSFDAKAESSSAYNVKGGAGDDVIATGGGNDWLVAGSGFDVLVAGAGDDALYFGGGDFTTADYADGGAGNDTLYLQGTIDGPLLLGVGQLFNLERLELLSGSDARFGDTAGNLYSYNLRMADGNLASGRSMTVDFSALRSEEHVIFGARDETDGSYVILGGFGDDTVAGGVGNDTFTFGDGRWGNDDSVDGWTGTDLLSVQLAAGNNALAFTGNQIVGIETLELRGTGSSGQHTVTLHDGNVASGQTLTVNATAFGSGERLVLNGAAETDGNLVLRGGNGNDVLIAGRGTDALYGGGGDDALYFGAHLSNGDIARNGTVYLQGNYLDTLIIAPGTFGGAPYTGILGIPRLVLMSGSDSQFGDTGGNSYSYNLRLSDGNVEPTFTYIVDFSGLGPEEHVIFGARDEPDNNLRIFGGFGDDTIAAGGRDDTISFGVGRWGNDDSVDGWTGDDTLSIATGPGNTTIAFAGNQIFNIERLHLSNGAGAGTITIKLHDGNVSAGKTLMVNSSFSSDDKLIFDGSAELDGNLIIEGGPGDDVLIAGHGSDSLSGGSGGNDALYFGDRYGPGDTTGRGTTYLQGNYSGVVVRGGVLMSGTDTRFGDLAGNLYSYDIIGPSLGRFAEATIDGRGLTAGESFTFQGNGGSRLDSLVIVYGGFGRDTFNGGPGSSEFRFDLSRWGSDDSVDGGSNSAGTLTMQLGAGPDTLTLGANQMFNMSTLKLLSGGSGSHTINMNDGNVSFGKQMVIHAQVLKAGEQLIFNGSETDGSYRVLSGKGNDRIAGGANGDQLRGDEGADVFVYNATSRSTPGARDYIEDFTSGDRIDLGAIDANGAAGGDQAFSFIGSAAFSNTAGELRASHASGADWLIQGDTDGNGIADFELLVTLADADPITASDFVL